jgi:hypothetical protein
MKADTPGYSVRYIHIGVASMTPQQQNPQHSTQKKNGADELTSALIFSLTADFYENIRVKRESILYMRGARGTSSNIRFHYITRALGAYCRRASAGLLDG